MLSKESQTDSEQAKRSVETTEPVLTPVPQATLQDRHVHEQEAERADTSFPLIDLDFDAFASIWASNDSDRHSTTTADFDRSFT